MPARSNSPTPSLTRTQRTLVYAGGKMTVCLDPGTEAPGHGRAVGMQRALHESTAREESMRVGGLRGKPRVGPLSSSMGS